MKTFNVNMEVLRGSLMGGIEVYSDGEVVDENSADEIEIREIITGYSVQSYNEDGRLERSEFYPVKTDMTSWRDNREAVLTKIKADFPAEQYNNPNW